MQPQNFMFPVRVLMHKIYLFLNTLFFQGNVLIGPQLVENALLIAVLLPCGSPGCSKARKENW